MNLPILPTLSTSFIIISAILVAIGWRKIWKREIESHKKVMLSAAFLHSHSLSFMLQERFSLVILLSAVQIQ